VAAKHLFPVLRQPLKSKAMRMGRVIQAFPTLILARVMAGNMFGDGQPMVHIRKNGLHY
jgi:hypothetical protein